MNPSTYDDKTGAYDIQVVAKTLSGLAFPNSTYVAGKSIAFIPFQMGQDNSGFYRYICITNMNQDANNSGKHDNIPADSGVKWTKSIYLPNCLALGKDTYGAVVNAYKAEATVATNH